jgi:MFS family permease
MMVWSIPFFISLLGGGLYWIGIVEGIRESVSSLLKLASGWFSDRIGKRKLLVGIGYGISTVVKPVLALAAVPWQALSLLTFERVGKGIRTAPRDALLAGAVEEGTRARAFSFHRMMDNTGAVIGLGAGAGLAAWLFSAYHRAYLAGSAVAPVDVFRTIYLIATVPAVLSILAIVFLVKEEAGPTKRVRLSFRAGYDRKFWVYLGAVLLFALGNSSDLLLLVRAGEVLHYPIGTAERTAMAAQWSFPFELPLMFLALSLAKAAFSLPGGILADRIGRARILAIGWAIYAGVYVAFGFATSAWQIWALLVAYGAFYGFSEGVEKAVVADYVRPEVRGAAYGLAAFAEGVAKLPASLLLVALYETAGPRIAFSTGGACAGAACLVLLILIVSGRRTSTAA